MDIYILGNPGLKMFKMPFPTFLRKKKNTLNKVQTVCNMFRYLQNI